MTDAERRRNLAQFAAMAPRWNKVERPRRLEIWLTDAEYASLVGAADRERAPTATWARQTLCDAAKPPVAKRKPTKKATKKKGGRS